VFGDLWLNLVLIGLACVVGKTSQDGDTKYNLVTHDLEFQIGCECYCIYSFTILKGQWLIIYMDSMLVGCIGQYTEKEISSASPQCSFGSFTRA